MNDEMQRCYRVLELEPGASLNEVKEAWRVLAKVWHPDRFPNDEKLQRKAGERLKDINGAYKTLGKHLVSRETRSKNHPTSTQSNQPAQTDQSHSDLKSDLFLKRDVKDEALIAKCKSILDKWTDEIPFSPIRRFTNETRFISAAEFAAYKITVTTQIERRELKAHREPYRGEPLPSNPHFDESDLWNEILPVEADFNEHTTKSYPLDDSRMVKDCDKCDATGQTTCPTCRGHGFNKCSLIFGCGGSGLVSKVRVVEKKVGCCSRRDCHRCGGRGWRYDNVREEYTERCSKCAGKGEVPCSDCNRSGKVTCDRCEGTRRLLIYASIEQTEIPVKDERLAFPAGLPQFKKKNHPLSNISGDQVFTQNELSEIKIFRFINQPAGQLLSTEVELCRKAHNDLCSESPQGRIIRQQIDVTRYSIIEYRYIYDGNEHAIFLNPSNGVVEDMSGPIQTAIDNQGTLAKKAFEEKRYEDAYRLNLRSLCMDEPSDSEINLRNQIISHLGGSYLNIALLVWGATSISWWFLYPTAINQNGNYGVFLGILPLLIGVHLFARDLALRFQRRRVRLTVAALIGISAFLSGITINEYSFTLSDIENHFIDWYPLLVATLMLIVIVGVRTKERKRRVGIEDYIKEYPDMKTLESYICSLDPNKSFENRTIVAITAFVLGQLVAAVGIKIHHSSNIDSHWVYWLALLLPICLLFPENRKLIVKNERLGGVRELLLILAGISIVIVLVAYLCGVFK